MELLSDCSWACSLVPSPYSSLLAFQVRKSGNRNTESKLSAESGSEFRAIATHARHCFKAINGHEIVYDVKTDKTGGHDMRRLIIGTPAVLRVCCGQPCRRCRYATCFPQTESIEARLDRVESAMHHLRRTRPSGPMRSAGYDLCGNGTWFSELYRAAFV